MTGLHPIEIFDDIIWAVLDAFNEASPETVKAMEPDFVALRDLERYRRPDEFLIGKHLCSIRMKLADEKPELADKLLKALGKISNQCYRAMRLYQRFAAFEHCIPLIAARVQRFFAETKYMPEALHEVVAMARDGREVTYTVFAEEILPKYASLTESSMVEDPPAELPPAGDSSVESERFNASQEGDNDNDDTDPWDVDDEDDDDVLEPSTRTASAPRPTATVPKVDRVDLDDMRVKLIRNLDHELTGAFRSIEDFCETYHIRKGGWFLRFKSGADKAREAIKAWQKEKLDRH